MSRLLRIKVHVGHILQGLETTNLSTGYPWLSLHKHFPTMRVETIDFNGKTKKN